MQAGRGTAKPPIGIALEGDLGARIDALLAIAMLNGFASKGEARKIAICIPRASLREETVKLANKLMEKSPAVLRYTKEALRAVRFMNEPQAADYLGAKSDALRFVDREDSRTQGMKQFLDEKSYRPGFSAFRRQRAKSAP